MAIKARDELTIGKVSDGGKITEVVYQAGASRVTAPTGDWSSKVVATSADKPYLWTRSKYEYIDTSGTSKSEYAYTVGGTIEGVQVGGRNLLRNSDNGYLDDLSVFLGGTDITYTIEDKWRKISFTSQLNNEIVQQKYYTPTQLGTYTFSILCKTDATYFSTSVSWYTSKGHDVQLGKIEQLDENLYRISSTHTISSLNAIRIVDFVGFNTSGATYISFRYPKFEKGNKATDWTPAPEDVDGAISTAQSAANNAAKTATNYLYQDSTNGLVVGYKDSSGNWAAARSQMKSDGFYVIRKDGTEVGHFKDSEVLIGQSSANNVLINTNGMAIRNNGTTYASFNASRAQIGQSSGKHAVIYSGGLSIYDGDTSIGNFGANSATIGKTTGSNNNVLIGTNGMQIRKGTNTTYASFSGSSAQIGSSTANNIHIDSDGISIREGNTNLAKFKSSTNTTFNLTQTELIGGGLMIINTDTLSRLSSSYSNDNVSVDSIIAASTLSTNGNTRVGTISLFTSTSGLSSSSTFKNHTSRISMSSEGTDIYYKNDTDNKYTQIYMGSDGSIGFNGSSIMNLGGSNTQIRTGLKIKSDTDGVNPYISFYRDSEKVSDTPAGRIILYDSNKYMSFNYAGRYIFDNSIYLYDGLVLRSNDDASTAVRTTAVIATKWADGNQHNIIERTGSGVVTALGWAGTGTYKTTTVLRGSSCRLGSTSGTTITSDERLKKDFSSLDKWDKFFDNLEPCAFKMKAGTSGRYHVGFKAQQVEKALIESGLSTADFGGFIKSPYVKDDDDNPDTLAVYEEAGINPGEDEYGLIYTEFTALNTYEIQKLKKRIEALEDLLTKED